MFDFLRPSALIECDGPIAYIIDRASGSFLETVRERTPEAAIEKAEAWCKRNGYRIERPKKSGSRQKAQVSKASDLSRRLPPPIVTKINPKF